MKFWIGFICGVVLTTIGFISIIISIGDKIKRRRYGLEK